MHLRNLEENDIKKGYLQLLNQLTVHADIGNITDIQFRERFASLHNMVIRVIEMDNRIVATATLFLEPKFIHNLGYVGHIEDVVVDSAYRGAIIGSIFDRESSGFGSGRGLL